MTDQSTTAGDRPGARVLLQATGLRRVFAGVAAVDGVTLTIKPGDRHAVVGPNGAGKTTLLNLIAGTQRPTTGTITWRGRDITRASTAARARAGIGRTFQTPTVVGALSTVDNVVLGLWPHIRQPHRMGRRYRHLAELADAHLQAAGLGGHARIPAGELAHGQRRLLDIVMAVAGRPDLLLLDEPAAGLDTTDLDRLLDLLTGLPDSTAVLLVEHHLDLVTALARTVTVLHQGRVVATGSPAWVLAHPDVRTAYPGLATTAGGGWRAAR